MARIRHGAPNTDCIKNCPKYPWTYRNMVECQGYCNNYFHDKCVGISKDKARETEWFCEECVAHRDNLDSNRPLDNQDTINISSQELQPLAEEADRLFHDLSSNTVANSADARGSNLLNQHIRQMQEQSPENDEPIEDFDDLDTRSRGENNQPQTRNRRQDRTPATNQPIASTSRTEPVVITNQARNNSSGSESDQEDQREYYVDSIIDDALADDGTRLYRVRWKGYRASEDTWEPELQFVKLYDRLKAYKLSKGLGPPIFRKRYGNNDSLKGRESNWATAEKIINTAIGFIPTQHRNKLPIRLITYPQQLDDTDHLYLIDFENHALVGLYYAQDKTLIICDGENIYQNDAKAREHFNNWFQINIKPITFLHQTKVDFCASSASILLYKLAEIYSKGLKVISPITMSKERHDKMMKIFHSDASEPLKPWTSVKQQNIYKCEFQGCSFSTFKRDARVMRAHQLRHK